MSVMVDAVVDDVVCWDAIGVIAVLLLLLSTFNTPVSSREF